MSISSENTRKERAEGAHLLKLQKAHARLIYCGIKWWLSITLFGLQPCNYSQTGRHVGGGAGRQIKIKVSHIYLPNLALLIGIVFLMKYFIR